MNWLQKLLFGRYIDKHIVIFQSQTAINDGERGCIKNWDKTRDNIARAMMTEMIKGCA